MDIDVMKQPRECASNQIRLDAFNGNCWGIHGLCIVVPVGIMVLPIGSTVWKSVPMATM